MIEFWYQINPKSINHMHHTIKATQQSHPYASSCRHQTQPENWFRCIIVSSSWVSDRLSYSTQWELQARRGWFHNLGSCLWNLKRAFSTLSTMCSVTVQNASIQHCQTGETCLARQYITGDVWKNARRAVIRAEHRLPSSNCKGRHWKERIAKNKAKAAQAAPVSTVEVDDGALHFVDDWAPPAGCSGLGPAGAGRWASPARSRGRVWRRGPACPPDADATAVSAAVELWKQNAA